MKKLLALLVLFGSLGGAQDTLREYIVYKETALTAAAEKITIQQPTIPTVTVVGEVASIYCSVACNATITQLGTAATATAATINSLNGGFTSQVSAYSGSNSTGGTVLNTIAIGAGSTQAIDISRLYLSRGAGINFSIGTDSITGTVRITIQFEEKLP